MRSPREMLHTTAYISTNLALLMPFLDSHGVEELTRQLSGLDPQTLAPLPELNFVRDSIKRRISGGPEWSRSGRVSGRRDIGVMGASGRWSISGKRASGRLNRSGI